VQDTSWNGTPVQNVIAKQGNGSPWIILGAHYDTREWADQDPNPANREKPVPGANDGASGVAVLLELARSLPKNLHGQIWLVFFDMEDDGGIYGQDWIMGSQAFVSQLTGKPDAAVIVDMVGDANLNIYKERNSTAALTDQIWQSAAQLGYDEKFIPKYRYSMEDDHTPFLAAGIPAVDIIDFDYPYWHTVQDTVDKVSATSLQTVGDVLYHWLVEK
jgi:glutaminyl-peptide cyclotransferase